MNPSVFQDHFSGHAADYRRHRPAYPDALFAWLADLAPRRASAWDCATGNGQAALGLVEFFAAVSATDASARQIAAAAPHPRVRYRVAPAEDSGLAAGSVDLITVAQALHWFRFEAFFAEARRVLRPGGVLAAWGYGLMRIAPAVDGVVERLYRDIVGPHWPPERHYLEAQYRTLPFPWAEIPVPEFTMTQRWTLAQLLGYLGTWSAVRRYRKQTGRDPLALVGEELGQAWGTEAARPITWPLYLRVGRQAGCQDATAPA